ncbi:hypothetical protein [Paraburkholderia sp. BR10882]|uniref:hypothetical protein n=1 Tax=unclassified Paraburkholderia TaxID=2615204 RepID=UPI0034CDB2AF
MNTTVHQFDLTKRNGLVALDKEVFEAGVGIAGDHDVAVEHGLPAGQARYRCDGKYVLPGRIDTHYHVEQRRGINIKGADD